ncbi:hypothetical protein HanPSC8_Chr13g0570651 [Helianthus annuus]|nr:hypothetical protein HanPSC8_Chr13g0570651 [Helianthus annuus]
MMNFSPSSAFFSSLSTKGGSGPHVLSVVVKVSKVRPTLWAAACNRGIMVCGNVELLV